MNIYDIAKMCGVSTATVSRVINGGSVSEETRSRVNAVLNKTGYRPNPYAQGMNLGSMRVIGIMVSEINDLYYVRAVSTLEQSFRRLGYDIILYSVEPTPKNVRKYIDQLLSRKVAAIFTVGSVFHEVQDELSTDGTIPIITVNLETENNECYNVFCDDDAALEDAVRFLYERGHRSFLYLYDNETVSGTAKLHGFRRGIKACGLDESAALVYNCPRDIYAARETAAQLLTEHSDITAVLTSVDELAVGVLKAAPSLGKCVPKSLAVIGYDNSILSDCATPRITSIDNKVDDLCTLGVNLFSDLTEGKPVARKYILNCELIEKETT